MRAVARTLHRLRSIPTEHPRLADAALVLLVGALTVAPLAGARHVPPWTYALVAAECLPLLRLRDRPFAVAVVVGAVTVLHSVAPMPEPVLPWASLVAVYGVAADASRRLALLSAVLLAVVVPVALLLDPRPASVESFVASGVVYAAAWLLGDRARYRRDRSALLEQQAVTAERARMAREMHDVLGHHLSLIVVQAEAGPALLAQSPDAAVRAFDAVSETARQALQELRQVLGTLRGMQPADLEPVPGVDALPGLLAGVGRGGLAVEHVVTGDVVPLPPAGDRAAFRVVQEALTNVVRHGAASAATVALHYTADTVEVRVCNDGPVGRTRGRAGHGLIGMRERVTAAGGRFSAGPAEGGGWQVVAVIPARDPR
jgi:signal transduction histidine kinase